MPLTLRHPWSDLETSPPEGIYPPAAIPFPTDRRHRTRELVVHVDLHQILDDLYCEMMSARVQVLVVD